MTNLRSRLLLAIAINVLWISAFAIAHAHPASERFIPIGQSPGISGKYSYVGVINAVNAANWTITVVESGSPMDIKVTESTKIWLDRSKRRKTNLSGNYQDCGVGDKVEIKFVDPDAKDTAEWIKVESR